MATGLIKNTTIIGIKSESTAGTYAAPSATTDYLQPLEDGFELSPGKELLDRAVLDSSIGFPTPRTGLKTVSASLPVEFRASGTEGSETDFDLLVKGALGNRRQVASNTTITAGSTTTVFNLSAPDAALFTVGDVVVSKDPGLHSIHAVTAVGATSITVTPAKAAPPTTSSTLSKTTVYYPANSGHPSLSLSYYWGNEIREAAIGCKVTSLSLDSFETGKLASFNFSLDGLSFTQIDGAAPATPAYDTGLPPVILNACVYMDGTAIDVNVAGLSLENELGFVTSTCSSNGRTASRVTSRKVSGTINPYKDDTAVTNFTKFNADTTFSLFITAYTPSSTSGEFTMGSVLGIWLPSCLVTELKVGDQEGILTDEISFQANRGSSGGTDECFIGFI